MSFSNQLLQTRRLLLKSLCVGASLLSISGWTSAADGTWEDVKKAGVLRCGAAVAAPYVMRDARSGEYSGFFVDLCRDFGEKELGVKVEFMDTNWDNLVAGLQSGSWDLAMALNETPERKRAVAFSSAAMDYQISFIVNKDNPKLGNSGTAVEDYDKPGVRFVVMSGTAQDKLITQTIKNGSIQRLPGVDETRLALISRRADVLVDASDTNKLFIAANPDWTREVLLEPALGKMPVAFGMRLNRSEADIQALSEYVDRRRAAGEIDALIDKAAKDAVEASKAAR